MEYNTVWYINKLNRNRMNQIREIPMGQKSPTIILIPTILIKQQWSGCISSRRQMISSQSCRPRKSYMQRFGEGSSSRNKSSCRHLESVILGQWMPSCSQDEGMMVLLVVTVRTFAYMLTIGAMHATESSTIENHLHLPTNVGEACLASHRRSYSLSSTTIKSSICRASQHHLVI